MRHRICKTLNYLEAISKFYSMNGYVIRIMTEAAIEGKECQAIVTNQLHFKKIDYKKSHE